MLKYFIQYQIYTLFIAVFVFSASNGQVITNIEPNNIGEQKVIEHTNIKLIKAKGAHEYNNVRCS